MMGRQSRQMAMIFVDMESLIPENHLLRKIDRTVSFNFIYDLLAPYYPATGRPSVDPVSMFKMLLIGYLYGIKSERRLVEEVQLNIAYRWFCGFELDDAIPDHSTFSKTRTRKWQQSDLFQKVFCEIVKQCIDSGLIDGEAMAADGSYIPANVSRESWIDVEIEVEQSMQSYLDSLDEELSNQPGFKKPPTRIARKRRTTSQTDPDCGYINHGNKRGIGYLMEATVDCKHGILTGVDVYPANEKESTLVLRHLERQINLGVPMKRLALDRGYETGAVHRGLELLGITGYIPAIQFSNPPEKYGFSYDPQLDAFICPEGVPLTYHRLNCNKSTGKYLRCYQVEGDTCMYCPKRPNCFDKAGIRRRVLASSCYPAFFRGHQRVGTPEYLSMMRLRKIWAEGSFSVLKREHCISKIRKRGILAATEECLLAATALNLKRIVNAAFFLCYIPKLGKKTRCFSPNFAFCQQVPYSTLSRNDFTEKPLRQFFFVQPGGLRRHIVTGISLCIRSGLANSFLDGEPLTVSAAVQLLSQFPDGSLIRLLRSAGAVVVELDSQFLKGHALLVRLANSQITAHQIQLSGLEYLLHALEEQRPAHEAVIGFGWVAAIPQVKDALAQTLDLKHGTVFFQQTPGDFGGDRQLLLNGR